MATVSASSTSSPGSRRYLPRPRRNLDGVDIPVGTSLGTTALAAVKRPAAALKGGRQPGQRRRPAGRVEVVDEEGKGVLQCVLGFSALAQLRLAMASSRDLCAT